MNNQDYIIPNEYIKGKRKNYSSWDECFMLHAVVTANRSKDPSSQVGAVLVGRNNRILSLGYNGAPNMWKDEDFPWVREADTISHTKYPYVIHAEMNALCNTTVFDVSGSKIYCTLYPCCHCAKLLVQRGISEVIYLSDKHHNDPEYIAARKLFNAANVITRQYLGRVFLL